MRIRDTEKYGYMTNFIYYLILSLNNYLIQIIKYKGNNAKKLPFYVVFYF